MTKRLLVIDSLNNFIRNYVIMPHLSRNGDPIGGIVGYLLSLQKIVRETKPDLIIAAWDGEGGSLHRKQSNKDYKEGRSPLRLNRSVKAMSETQNTENRLWQQVKLFEILNFTPVMQLIFNSVEADDIISYVCRHKKFTDWQKIIVSSDKDFYQLLDDKTVLMRPIQKEVVNKNNVLEEYEIHPNNFAIARAVVGDKSDNLPGVPGAGLKTIAKRFPFLRESKQYLVDDLLAYCDSVEKKYKIHEDVKKSSKLIEQNYKIMQLDSPLIPYGDMNRINHILDNMSYEFNATQFRKISLQEGFADSNFQDLFACFNRIVRDNKKV